MKEMVSRPEEEIISKSSSSYKRPLATDWKPLQFARVSYFIDNYKTHEVRWIKEFLESEGKCISDLKKWVRCASDIFFIAAHII